MLVTLLLVLLYFALISVNFSDFLPRRCYPDSNRLFQETSSVVLHNMCDPDSEQRCKVFSPNLYEPIAFSEEQKLAFVNDGYIILRKVVSEELVSAANVFIDNAKADGMLKDDTRKMLGEDVPTYRFSKDTAESPEVTDLLFKTGLYEAAEGLLGEDYAVVTGNMGHLDIVPTCEVFVERGMKINRPHPKKRWKVYAGMGKHAKKGAGYSVLISVALSEEGDANENRGQIVVWPGSHYATQKAIAKIVQDMSEGDDSLKILHHEKDMADCGDPVRLVLSPGDVLIAHQKLAIGAAVNLVEDARRSVFFRIAHSQTDKIVDQQVNSKLPWVGFAGLADFVEEEATEFTEKKDKLKHINKRAFGLRASPAPVEGEILSTEQKETFIRDGFLIISGAVPQDKVKAAVDLIDDAYEKKDYNINGITKPGSKHPVPGFHKMIKEAPEVLDLLYGSVLFNAAEELLGKGNVVIRNNQGQIAYTTPSEEFIKQGMDINEPHPKRRWHIDAGHGKYAAVGSDFSLLIGICLSDGQYIDENRGQFTVWLGSHLTTHTTLSEVIESTPANDVVRTFQEQKLDVGEPRRALMHPGDAFIAHQRLAHAAGINLSDTIRKNVYFRAIDVRLDWLLHDFVRSPTPWVGFNGLKDLLPEGVTEFDKDAKKKAGKAAIAASSAPEKYGSYKMTKKQKKEFIKEGYVVLPDVVSMDLVEAALSVADKAFEDGLYHMNGRKRIGSNDPVPAFLKKVRKNRTLKDLFFKSGLVDASEQLIGKDHVTLRENLADISFMLPNEEFVSEGMDMKAPYPKKQWRLDPLMPDFKGLGADYNFYVGIALSDGQDVDENRGQLVVWPGSHLLTHAAMSEALKEESPTDNIMPAFRKKKLNLGDPKRVLTKPGDVVVVHQRVGFAPGINLSDNVRKMVFFRIIHTEFDHLLEEYSHAPLPFVGYEPIQELVKEVLG